ncbi:MAG TPA: Ig-like domain-containing protein, partial [Candidatus Krumholzibacterium sp.]|nr:Ig-like domain-containing protein [Candidatus Krumholzibacterium sp.]
MTVLDAEGNPVSGSSVVLESSGSGNLITQPVGVTGPGGVATGRISSTVAETKTVRARIDGSYMTGELSLVFRPGDVSLTLSTISGDKSTVVADGVDEVGVTVTVRDSDGNTVSGSSVVLESSGSGNTITQPVGVTGSNGIAVGAVSSTVAEGKTVRALVDGSYLVAELTVSFVAGPVDLGVSEIASDVDTVVADGSDEAVITVTVLDAEGNPVSGSSVVLESSGSGNLITQPVGVTGPGGVATGRISSTVAETKTVRARIDGSYMTGELSLVFIAGDLDYFVITHDGNATAGTGENIHVEAFDAEGNMVEGFDGIVTLYTDSSEPTDMITWGIGDGAGSILDETGDVLTYQFSASDGGDVTFSITDNRAESIYIIAESGTALSASATRLTVGHGAADRVFIISGDGQRAVVGYPVPLPLVAAVEDRWGNRVSGETVTFSVVSGGGSIDTDTGTPGIQTSETTGSAGTVSCDSWILGTTSGQDSDGAR